MKKPTPDNPNGYAVAPFPEDGRSPVLRALIGDHAPNGAGGHADEGGTLQSAGLGDSSLSDLVRLVKSEFGNARVNEVIGELLDFLADEGWLSTGGGTGLDDESAAGKIAAFHRKAWRLLISYQELQKPKMPRPKSGLMFTQDEMMGHIQAAFDQSLMSSRAMALELGFMGSVCGGVPAQVAKKFGYGKFTFCKCCEQFQTSLRMPKRPGQRDEGACDAMAEARTAQLKKS